MERASAVPGAVLWRRLASRDGEARVIPDGCLDLIWTGEGLLVAGPDTRAHFSPDRAGTGYVGLRFAPGTGPAVLGVPAHELTDDRVPLAHLWPERDVRRLANRLATSARPSELLEQVALEQLITRSAPDRLLARVVAGLRVGTRVRAVAAEVGLSVRQLHRRSLPAFGYGPKTLARILRMQRALVLARGGYSGASVAAMTGYADQPHLVREVRALTGTTLREYRG